MFLVVLISGVLSQPVYAYGGSIHTIICEAVWQRLQPSERQWLRDTMRDGPVQRFSTGCAWPDWIKKDEKYFATRSWHYQDYHQQNIHTFATAAYDVTTGCRQGCLLPAINSSFRRLLDSEEARHLEQQSADFPYPYSRVEALFFLSHLLVDLHQPLHVGRMEDKGGNTIDIRWLDRRYSLHHWWDGRLLQTLRPDWASELQQALGALPRLEWPEKADFSAMLVEWLLHSRRIAAAKIYPYYHDNKKLSVDGQQPFTKIMLDLLTLSVLRLEATIVFAIHYH